MWWVLTNLYTCIPVFDMVPKAFECFPMSSTRSMRLTLYFLYLRPGLSHLLKCSDSFDGEWHLEPSLNSGWLIPIPSSFYQWRELKICIYLHWYFKFIFNTQTLTLTYPGFLLLFGFLFVSSFLLNTVSHYYCVYLFILFYSKLFFILSVTSHCQSSITCWLFKSLFHSFLLR